MNSKQFIQDAIKTESNDLVAIGQRLNQDRTIRLLHVAMGLCTEAGEFMDAMKKFIFYGKDLDLVNLKEELGDIDWYKAIACDELGADFEEIWERIIAKLKARYSGKFEETQALNRDLATERAILEQPPADGMNDVQFLDYIYAHSQTQRALFSMAMFTRLCKLAGESASDYDTPIVMAPDFICLRWDAARPLHQLALTEINRKAAEQFGSGIMTNDIGPLP